MKKWRVPPQQRGYCKRCLRSTHIAPSTSIRVEASLHRSAALRGWGALKSAAGSSFSHDVREGERWVVLRNWVHAILLRHLQLSRQRRRAAYPRSCKWCRTQAHFDPTPLGGNALPASLRYDFVGKRAQSRIRGSTYPPTKLGSAFSFPPPEVCPFFAPMDWSFTHEKPFNAREKVWPPASKKKRLQK